VGVGGLLVGVLFYRPKGYGAKPEGAMKPGRAG